MFDRTLTGAVALAMALLLAAPTSAQAAVRTSRTVGDPDAAQVFSGNPPAAQRRSSNITMVTYSVDPSAKRFYAKMRFADLVAPPGGARSSFQLSMTKSRRGDDRVVNFINGRSVFDFCPGARLTVNRAADFVVIRTPLRCVFKGRVKFRVQRYVESGWAVQDRSPFLRWRAR